MNHGFLDQFTKKVDFNGIELFKDKENNEAFKIFYPHNSSILVFNMNNNYSKEESRSNRCLSYIVAYYLKLLENHFFGFFEEYNVNPNKLEFYIFPESYYKRNKSIKCPDFELNSNLNIKINFVRETQTYNIILVHNMELFNKCMVSETNECERYILKKILGSFFYQFRHDLPNDIVDTYVYLLIDATIPSGVKYVDFPSILNNRLLDYSDPISPVKNLELAYELIIYFLDENEIKPGFYRGNELKKVLNKVYMSAQLQLESELSKFNKEIVYFIYKQIEYFTHKNKFIKLQFGKSAKISKIANDKLKIVKDRIEWSEGLNVEEKVIRHLLETALKVCPEGKKDVTIDDFQNLEILCAICMQIATISDFIYFKLGNYSLKIHEDYTVSWNNVEEYIDGRKHGNAYNEMALNSDIIEYKLNKYSTNTNDLKNDSLKLPHFYLNLDKAFESDFGFKYSDFISMLFMLSVLETQKDEFYPLIYLDEESLIEEIKNVSYLLNIKIPSSIIRNILKFISIDPEGFKESDVFLPNDLKMKRNRFVLRPLIKSKDKDRIFYLYGIESVLFTAEIYDKDIREGKFPYKIENKEGCTEKVKNICKEIKLIKKVIETKLEKELDEKLSELLGKEYVESNLENFHRIANSLEKKPKCGEIDSLAVDKENKIIHVFEAKYINTGKVPQEMGNEMNKFSPEGKYVTKLSEKYNFVSSNIEIFLKKFEISDSEGWQVKSAFVTYDVQISSFSTKNKTKFIRLSQLEDYLSSCKT